MVTQIEKYKKIIMDVIMRHAPQVKVILYGSRARGDDTPGSDIDVALDAGKKMDNALVGRILEDLEESDLPIFFDVVDFRAVSVDLQKEIIKDGVIWKE